MAQACRPMVKHSYNENEEIPIVEPVGAGLPLKDTGAPVSRVMPSGYGVRTRDKIADAVRHWCGPARVPGSSLTVRNDPIPVVGPSSSSVLVASLSVSPGPVVTELRRSTRERHLPPKLRDYVKS